MSQRLQSLNPSAVVAMTARGIATAVSNLDKVAGLKVLVLGNGPGRQYADPDLAVKAAAEALKGFVNKQNRDDKTLILIFGGDTAVREKPDIGIIIKGLKESPHLLTGWNLRLLSVQSWKEVQSHVDMVRYYPEEGHYGGFDKETGSPVGGTAVYLGPSWLKHTAAVLAVDPRGRVGLAELAYVESHAPEGLAVIKCVAEPRFP